MDLLQRRMEREPGYCGRNEITDRHDDLQKKKLAVEARRISPEGMFYSLDQWETRLSKIVEEYNAEPQDGKMLNGLSPDEAFEKWQNPNNPPIKFDAPCRYLLAHHKTAIKVGKNGITLRFGKKAFNYHSEETGSRIGQTVLAWFNPEEPEVLVITDMQRRNPVSIQRTQLVPAFDAPSELLKEELSKVASHQNYGRARCVVLKAKFPQLFRKTVIDRQTVEVGHEIAAQKAEIQSRKRQFNRNRRAAAELGILLPKSGAEEFETNDSLEEFKRSQEALRAQINKQAQP
jgi:hypothetical protein